MVDNVVITAGTGTTVAADEVTDGTLGSCKVQYVKLMDGTLDGTGKIGGDATNGLQVNVTKPPTPAVVTMQSAAAATGNGTSLDVRGYATALLSITGTFSATLIFEASIDDTTWTAIQGFNSATSYSTGANGVGDIWLPVAGYKSVRARISAYTSGNVTVKGAATQATSGPNGILYSIQAPLPIGTNVIGGVTVAAGATSIAKAEDVASADADVGVPAMAIRKATPANTSGTDGDYEMLQVSAGRLWASATIDTALPAGANVIGSVTQSGTWNAVDAGDVAHGSANSGNPVQIGVEAIAHGANPTATAAGNRTKLYANRAGVGFVIGGHPNVITYGMSLTTAVSNTVIGPTIGAGLKLVITRFTLTLDNASTVFPTVTVGFGTVSTPAFATTPGTVGVLAGHPALPAGGGFNIGDGSGIVGIGADNEELRITTVGNAGGAGIYITFSGYTIES